MSNAPQQRFRWQIVPIVLSFGLGVPLGLLISAGIARTAFDVYGGRTLTSQGVFFIAYSVLIPATWICSGIAWWRNKARLGIILFLIGAVLLVGMPDFIGSGNPYR